MELKENCKILFQGDSITDGNRGRDEDLNHILGHGYVFMIAGKLGLEYPKKRLSFHNKGISGNRVVDLYARWQEDTLNIKPDVLSILVGINDILWEYNVSAGVSTEKYKMTYSLLLEETQQKLPDIKIVLVEPFALGVGGMKKYWDSAKHEIVLRQDTVRQLSKKYNTIFVPLQEEFNKACQFAEPEYWLWDGVHPTPAAHKLIAREWLKAVENA